MTTRQKYSIKSLINNNKVEFVVNTFFFFLIFRRLQVKASPSIRFEYRDKHTQNNNVDFPVLCKNRFNS